MTEAELWFAERLPGAPPALLASMTTALITSSEPLPNRFAQSALDLYAEVARGSGGREDALPLLAADALFTHAFEAQAELDPAGLDTLVARCARGLEEVLP